MINGKGMSNQAVNNLAGISLQDGTTRCHRKSILISLALAVCAVWAGFLVLFLEKVKNGNLEESIFLMGALLLFSLAVLFIAYKIMKAIRNESSIDFLNFRNLRILQREPSIGSIDTPYNDSALGESLQTINVSSNGSSVSINEEEDIV